MKLGHWAHILTLVFVAAKLFGAINWSWWLVFTPSLIYFGFLILLFTLLGILAFLKETI
jgi:hypothetical protein